MAYLVAAVRLVGMDSMVRLASSVFAIRADVVGGADLGSSSRWSALQWRGSLDARSSLTYDNYHNYDYDNAMRKIITQDAVDTTADALVAEGLEPTIIAIQNRIGGGSYSTVKRHLDDWVRRREQAAAEALEAPPEIAARGAALARSLWVMAARDAERTVQAVREETEEQVSAARRELSAAQSEIARLEKVQADQLEELETHQARIQLLEREAAAAEVTSKRVEALEKALAEVRAELKRSEKDARDQSVEAGRLQGEVGSLRRQLAEMIEQLGGRKSSAEE